MMCFYRRFRFSTRGLASPLTTTDDFARGFMGLAARRFKKRYEANRTPTGELDARSESTFDY
jgi:hypothetical protein